MDESEELVDLREVQWKSEQETLETTTEQRAAASQQTATSPPAAARPTNGPHFYTCSYGKDCLYPGGLKYRSHLCDKCEVRLHAMCSHEIGHTGYKVLCKQHAVEEHINALTSTGRTGRQVALTCTRTWWSHTYTRTHVHCTRTQTHEHVRACMHTCRRADHEPICMTDFLKRTYQPQVGNRAVKYQARRRQVNTLNVRKFVLLAPKSLHSAKEN